MCCICTAFPLDTLHVQYTNSAEITLAYPVNVAPDLGLSLDNATCEDVNECEEGRSILSSHVQLLVLAA
jgi:hypothetical protein